MTSSVDDLDTIPDLSSMLDQDLETDCRPNKDSSNDGDMFADSSGEESMKTFGFTNDMLSTISTAIDNSKKGDSEENPLRMSDEEQQFFSQYQKGTQHETLFNSLKCTVCSDQLFLVNRDNIKIHPVLGVLVCKGCLEFYCSGTFTKDDAGYDEYCRWCAEGGLVICCDTCTNVFCKACLRRCLDRATLQEIKTAGGNWSCLICNNLPIWSFRAQCRVVQEALDNPNAGDQSASDKEVIEPSVWLPACVADAEKLAAQCQALASRASSIWAEQEAESNKTETPDKKKVDKCCRQLRKAFSTVQRNVKKIEKKLVKQYTHSFGSTNDIEVNSGSESEASTLPTDETSPSGKRLVLKIKNFREANRKQDYYAEIRGSPNLKSQATESQIANETVAMGDRNEKSKVAGASEKRNQELEPNCGAISKETTSVKGSVPRASLAPEGKDVTSSKSLNEVCENPDWDPLGILEAEANIIERATGSSEPSLVSSPLSRRSLGSIGKNPDSSSSKGKDKLRLPQPVDKNELARKELMKDEMSDDSDDSLVNKLLSSPRMKKTKKRNRQDLDDPKLKSDCAVVINRINDVLKEPLSEDAKFKKKIDRLTSSLEPKVKSGYVSDSDEKEHRNGKMKKPKSVRNKDDEENDSIPSDTNPIESDSDMETSTPVKLPTMNAVPILDRNEAIRQELMSSSDSDVLDNVSDDEEEEEEEKKPVHKSTVKEIPSKPDNSSNGVSKAEAESDDDFQTSELKSSKLLRVSIADPDAKKEKSSSDGDSDEKKKKRDKKKRRIHSDSDSDFESEGNSKKKSKRRKKASSDDDEEEEVDKSKPKRRRRIKQTASSDEDEDSDIQVLNESQRSENGGKGRKNIKKIMKDKNLQDETKAAAKEEEDRKKRIAERQKRYNAVFVGDEALINAQIDQLVLDFDATTKQELVSVHKHLVTKLKPHQVKGVKFMWDACFESIERIKEHPGSGCILAHCMGLGKSLQVVTLVHTVLTHDDCRVKRALVVCPLSTVLNWVNEFKIWLPGELELEVYELSSVKSNDIRMFTLRNWFDNGGVMILGYDMYRNLTNETNKRFKPKLREVFQRTLVDPGPDLVVCDEGHLLKNEVTALSKAMNRISTKRRVVLTGTPLQNSLLEYHCMIQFVKPNLLGTKREFTNRFANPIKNGQAADSTDYDVRVMKRRAHVLHKMLEDSVQRFDYSVLTPFLPPKYEYVISVKMSDLQIKMYQYYLDRCAKGGPNATMSMGRGKGSGLFADFQELGRVWTHPKALHLSQMRRDLKAIGHSDSEGSIADFLDDRSGSESDEAPVVCLDDSGDEKSDDDENEPVSGWKSRTRSGRGNQPPPDEELGVTAPLSSAWWSQFVVDDDMVNMEHSGKLILLMDILRQCELIGDKVLVFSQSLVSLDLIEEFLAAEDARLEDARLASDERQETPFGAWRLNADYFRLDGSTTAELRKNWCNIFNNSSNLRARLFLISTRAGGLGINLVAANRVIIFDASWNPSHDVQSIFRVYRFGQKKPCYVYRFLAQGTMEEKIYDRQVTKLSLSCRVVDEQQIERHFNSADLSELYLFDPQSHMRRPTPIVPQDRLLAELNLKRKEWITTFHEHDSLLENKSEEELSESERKAAWDDFENEKRGVSNIVPDATAGLLGMPDILGLAGRSVAGIPLNNIAAMIYNSNPGINQDEFLGRLRLTVDQLQNFSVQQAAAAAAAAAQNSLGLQQPGDAQRLLMQRQVAAEQLKRQFGPLDGPGPGPSGIAPPRSRGRPTIGPHQRTDLYGLGNVIYNATPAQAAPNERPASGVTPRSNPSPKM